MISRYPRRQLQTRAQYARAPQWPTGGGDLLVNDPDGYPSDFPPIWWLGVDSGGGSYPIGPNGPWPNSMWAPGLPVVTRATALITGPLTSSPFVVADAPMPGDPQRTGPQLTGPRWLTDPMLLREDARIGGSYPAATRLARSVFWADWLRSAIWWGEGVFISTLDQLGQPVAGSLRLLHPLCLSTERDETGSVVWVIDPNPTDGGLPVQFDRSGTVDIGPVSYRLTVLRNPHSPVDQDGRSQGVFAMSPSAFRLGKQIQDYTSGTFRSGIPAGYLKVSSPDMSQDAANKLKANWLASHGGDRRSIAVLNAVTEFVPLTMSPVDAALTEVDRLNVAQVAYAFGLDPYTLGVSLGGSMTYNNIRDAWYNHRDFGLAPWIATVEDTLTALVPATQLVQVDLDGFENPTRQERYTALKTGVESGIITVDEAREIEGLPPLPDEPAPEPAPEPVPQQLQLVQQPDQQQPDQNTGGVA